MKENLKRLFTGIWLLQRAKAKKLRENQMTGY